MVRVLFQLTDILNVCLRTNTCHFSFFPSFFPSFLRVSVTYGHPYMIDVQDCDARLPSSGDATDLYLDQLVRLSVIAGKVMKNIYTYVLTLFSSLFPSQLALDPFTLLFICADSYRRV